MAKNADETADQRKARRRAERNLRHAHANGLMQGILSLLRPGDVVFDCGANVGDVTARLAQTGAEVHAFEPDPYAFGVLSRRFSDADNVTLYQAAVGVTPGKVRLLRAVNFDDNPKGGSVKSTILTGGRNINDDAAGGIEVDMISLPDRIRELQAGGQKIVFLKMDIEGAELELLEYMHAHQLFEAIDLTVAETHEHKFKALRSRFKKLRQEISDIYPVTKVNLDWI